MAIVAQPIDLTAIADFSTNGLWNIRVPVWQSGGDLYAIAKDQTNPTNSIGIWRSSDGGTTWAIQDAANEPDNSSVCANCLDGDQMYVLAGPRSDQVDLALRLYVFDCTLNTWSLIDGAGPVAHWASGLFLLSTGDFVIAFAPLGGSLQSAVWNGAAWTNVEDIGAVTSATVQRFDVHGCVDSADRVHLFFHDAATYWHIAVEPTFVLSAPTVLPALQLIGDCIFDGTNIVLSCSNGSLNVLIGAPFAAPVFTLSGAIDANIPDHVNLIYDATLGVYGLISLYAAQTTFLLAQSSDLISWTTADVYDANVDLQPPNINIAFGLFPAGLWNDETTGDIFLISNYRNTAIAAMTAFYIGSFPLTVPPPPIPPPLTINTGPRIMAQALAVVALGMGASQQNSNYIDNTGASRHCFPMKMRGSCK